MSERDAKREMRGMAFKLLMTAGLFAYFAIRTYKRRKELYMPPRKHKSISQG